MKRTHSDEEEDVSVEEVRPSKLQRTASNIGFVSKLVVQHKDLFGSRVLSSTNSLFSVYCSLKS
jgi:hypothetical protein